MQDNEIYAVARRIFSKETFVSTALLQRKLQIPYFEARAILDQMIKDEFCEKKFFSFPCRVIKIPKTN